MKIETPVATMGIRGTTGFVQEQVGTISANVGNVTYSFAVVEDYGTGHVGQYELVDNNPNSPTYGQVVALVSQNGFMTFISPQGVNLPPIVTTQPMTNSQLGFEQQIIQQVFQVLNSGTNANPQSNPGTPGSSTPPDELHNLPQLLQNNSGNTFTFNLPNGGNGQTTVTVTVNGSSNNNTNNNPGNQPNGTFIWTSSSDGNWDQGGDWNNGTSPGGANNVDVPLPIVVTVNDNEAAGLLTIGPGAIVDVGTGGALTIGNGLDDAGTLEATGDPPTITIGGPIVTVEGTGKILSIGAGVEILITAGTVDNLGVIAARHGGTIDIDGADSTVNNAGRIVARGSDLGVASNVTIDVASLTNEPDGRIAATHGGTLTLSASDFMLNTYLATILASGSGSTLTLNTNQSDVNDGTVEASNGGLLILAFDGLLGGNGGGGGNFGINEALSGGTLDIEGGLPNYEIIFASGAGSTINFSPNANGNEVQNFGDIGSGYGATINFDWVIVCNSSTGLISSNGGSVVFDHAHVENYGGNLNYGIDAAGGCIVFECSNIFNAPDALIQAQDNGSIAFYNSHIDNAGTILADGGAVNFDCVVVCNSEFGQILIE